MKHLSTWAKGLMAAATVALASIHPAAQARSDVGVSVSIDQPGFYGRVDIGDTRPTVVYEQPVIIQQNPIAMVRQPIYLRVPPGHYKRWGSYCGRYGACNQRVYFVQPTRVVHDHGHHSEKRHRHHRHEARERRHDRHDRHEHRHHRHERHDRGHGKGHGHGHGHRH